MLSKKLQAYRGYTVAVVGFVLVGILLADFGREKGKASAAESAPAITCNTFFISPIGPLPTAGQKGWTTSSGNCNPPDDWSITQGNDWFRIRSVTMETPGIRQFNYDADPNFTGQTRVAGLSWPGATMGIPQSGSGCVIGFSSDVSGYQH